MVCSLCVSGLLSILSIFTVCDVYICLYCTILSMYVYTVDLCIYVYTYGLYCLYVMSILPSIVSIPSTLLYMCLLYTVYCGLHSMVFVCGVYTVCVFIVHGLHSIFIVYTVFIYSIFTVCDVYIV